MNPNPAPLPRFTCRVVRLWHSVVASASSRHAATCPDCSRYFAACADLESALRGDSAAIEAPAPTGLERRIMHAVAAAPHPEPARHFPAARFALGAAAAAAIALVIGINRWWPEREQRSAEADSSRDVAGIAAAAEAFSDEWLNTKLPAASAVALDNPLRHELDSVYADARSALNFLALNFLPSTPATKTRSASGGKG